jgi:hypothetical protein
MKCREALECVAHEMAEEFQLADEDWDAVLAQVQRTLDAIAMLDELPLATVEPAAVFRMDEDKGA